MIKSSNNCIVKVTSRSFSNNDYLRLKLKEQFPNSYFNETGKSLHGQELVNFLIDAEKAIIALETFDKKTIKQLPNLKVLSKYGVGLNNIDLTYLAKKVIKLGWTPGVNKRAVAELSLCMMLSLLRNVHNLNQKVRTGYWQQEKGYQLSNKTVGIIGLGNVGKELVKLLKPFNCKILYYDKLTFSAFEAEYVTEKVDLPELITKSDIVSLHLPLTSATENLINQKIFSLFRPNAYFINTSRGGIVNDIDLIKVLKNKEIAGAAFDVFATEPKIQREILELNNLLITSHIGGSTEEAIFNMGLAAIKGLSDFMSPKEYLNIY